MRTATLILYSVILVFIAYQIAYVLGYRDGYVRAGKVTISMLTCEDSADCPAGIA